jgi:hypothetical protein
MGKYLVFWNVDQARIPVDPKERGEGWLLLMGLVKQDIEKGLMKDWGAFAGESNGYFIFEGTEVELSLTIQQYVPFFSFTSRAVSTVAQVNEILKALSG